MTAYVTDINVQVALLQLFWNSFTNWRLFHASHLTYIYIYIYIYIFILEGQIIETIWTIAPAVILVFIAIPSLCLLYLIDEIYIYKTIYIKLYIYIQLYIYIKLYIYTHTHIHTHTHTQILLFEYSVGRLMVLKFYFLEYRPVKGLVGILQSTCAADM